MADIRIAIDRGGTFCDAIIQITGREDIVLKILSEDPQRYPDAPTEIVRRALEIAEGRSIALGEKLDGSRIEACRIGTTVATNALLQHKGEPFALLTTEGMQDICELGDQTRPKLFSLNIQKARVLFDEVVELEERVTPEDYELNPFPITEKVEETDPDVVRTASGDLIRILKRLNVEKTREALQALRKKGFKSVAIAFMHSHIFPDHEKQVAEIAKEEGFVHIAISSEVSPQIKYRERATAVCTEVYLLPIIRNYVGNLLSNFEKPPKRLDFMCSDGGLRSADKFSGNAALLSGPAGGVVGIAKSCFETTEKIPIIGFDMGGTSTDICRFDGEYKRLYSTIIAGRKIASPMLEISTVAAGGGSILQIRNGLFAVGPESAGAHPGPACYRKGGPLTITDANLFLGRLVTSSFPSIFGPNGDQPVDLETVTAKFEQLTKDINSELMVELTPQQVALGFLKIANENMGRPIRNATEARGFATENHNLVTYGGAGPQHACAIASSLGINRIIIHTYSSILSAYGIALAEVESEVAEPCSLTFSMDVLPQIRDRIEALKSNVKQDLVSQGIKEASITYIALLSLHYQGTETILPIITPHNEDYGKAFAKMHLREFGFNLAKKVLVSEIKVRATGSAAQDSRASEEINFSELNLLKEESHEVSPSAAQPVYLDEGWQEVPIYRVEEIPHGAKISGPALLIDKTQSIVIEKYFCACKLRNHIIIDRVEEDAAQTGLSTTINPIQLSVFANRFMSIAEQMGNTLQRTSISTSIKERLDFSCAIFSHDGKLVANAPHVPVHLGSMQFAIQYQHRLWEGKLEPGDVLLTNHPSCGGTHLPDLTVITPVFFEERLVFYVASRGHHTDIGGVGITSMAPESKYLWEEGLNVKSMKIISKGVFLEDDIRAAFNRAADFPGCSVTRRINDNLSDLKAQASSNQRGINLLQKLCSEFGIPVVHSYMNGIQENAELAVRNYFRSFPPERRILEAIDYYDDGTPVKLKIMIDGDTGSATFDFEGTGPQIYGNMNAPISITYSAVIYALRCLIDIEIPLNQGCLNPVIISIPEGTILNPSPNVGICGGTISSQRITDTIFRAFGSCAASQGCANSFGWGLGGKDPATGLAIPGWNYGESLGGGSGAGPTWHGAHGTHVHGTNTPSTDLEIIEKRTAVIVRKYAINRGTGGKGRFYGGDGIIRRVEARLPLKFSIISERRVFRPYGMEGGEPGSVGRNFVYKKGQDGTFEKSNLGSKAIVWLEPGEIIEIQTPGGGGWGIPDS